MSQICVFTLLVLCAVKAADAGVTGTVSGAVKDETGGVVAGAVVTLRNVESSFEQTEKTNSNGAFVFPVVPIGHYEIEISATGFKPYKRTGLIVDVNSSVQENITLELGEQSQQITVSENVVQVETQSSEMGEALASATLAAVPLNGRSFTDLLALQPGVAPINSQPANAVVMAGVSSTPPSGDLNPGNQSISGQRETANGFTVNGSDVEEDVNMGVAILPNLDSISEFRILTNNFDAQYGNYSGGQIVVVTKSGTNAFHGDAFGFFRNTAFDAKPFFSPSRPRFDQNQFGGTLGGPMQRDRSFFFADYQGTRTTEGLETGIVSVPSIADRGGNLSDLANALAGSVSSPYFANLLTSKLGYSVSFGEPYYARQCATTAQCVFPHAVIPSRAWSAPAQFLLNYIPTPNAGAQQFYSSAYDQVVRDDKGSLRWDANTKNWGALTAYYYIDDYSLNNPYPQGQGGANVPSGLGGAFNASSAGRGQLISLGDTKTFGSTAVNEFHFSYMRFANDIGSPVGGVGVPLACQGFVTAVSETQQCPGSTVSAAGIYPLARAIEGIENVALQNLGITIGTDVTGLIQHNNTYQWADNFSKVAGAHTIRFGGEFHWDQVNTIPNATFNGSFQFNGSETGSDFADFLIGAASTYVQGEQGAFYPRNKYAGIFGQDSWRIRSNLTLNYGLRWDRIAPWYEKHNQIETFVPNGPQSVVYPGAPRGFLFPGDPGIPRTLSPVRNTDFAPRMGLAYSPGFRSGWLKKILGGPGTTSIRAGYGIFYTAFEGLSAAIMYTIPPYGYNFVPSGVLFATPTLATNGTNYGQPFPATFPGFGASARNPNTTLDWSKLEPITGDPAFAADNRPPYAEQYNLSLERQLRADLVLSLSYVGSQAHHLLVTEESNPGNPELCMQLLASGQCSQSNVDASRPFWPQFGGDTLQKTIGNSNYNAFEATLRYGGARGQFLAAYTYSKSIDDSSNLGESVDPFHLDYTRAISAFDMAHNLVISYEYKLPVASLARHANRLTEGWSLSGTTRFSTGLPVTLYNPTNASLLGTNPNGVNNNWLDEPNCTPGSLNLNTDPRNGRPEFNTALFSLPTLGTLGNCPRRFFYGPGIYNFDVALLKDMQLNESKALQLRLESFNIFNHPQFYGPSSVQGNISSPEFGQITGTLASPRILQVGVKLLF